jgi:nucleoid-associated protein YgaU
MRSLSFLGSGLLALVLVACGGSQPPASDASSETPAEEAPAETVPSSSAEGAEGEAATEEPAAEKTAKPEPKDPEFKENGSVNEAIAAVPVASDRLNIDQETLGKPLQDPALYEPCKPGNAKFKFRVAVWNGKAVGLDMSSTPKNPKLEECIKARIRELTWRDKVRALNTVEYQF